MTAAGRASEAYREQCAGIWKGLHEHPFIVELAEGTLPLDRFRFFLEQDNFYLEEYTRCLAMGAAKSRTPEYLRYFAEYVTRIIEAEIPNNVALLERVIEMGAEDRGGSKEMAPSNVAYTSYMQALALRGGPIDIMASLLPCSWSYIEIGLALAPRTDTTHPVYGDWIGYFARPETVEEVEKVRQAFDDLVAEEVRTDTRRAELGEIFATSSRLEGGFWEMAYTLERWPDARER
jgi:thiaminase/transcriptional activator TenA